MLCSFVIFYALCLFPICLLGKVFSGCFKEFFFHLGDKKKWSLVKLDRWSSYTVTIVWQLALADSALVVLDKWSSYRGGRLNRFECSFCQKIESIQCQASLAITGAIHRTSQTKLSNELRIESRKLRQWLRKLREWFRRLCYFFKIQSSGLPQYLNDLIPKPSLRYTAHFSSLPNFKV